MSRYVDFDNRLFNGAKHSFSIFSIFFVGGTLRSFRTQRMVAFFFAVFRMFDPGRSAGKSRGSEERKSISKGRFPDTQFLKYMTKSFASFFLVVVFLKSNCLFFFWLILISLVSRFEFSVSRYVDFDNRLFNLEFYVFVSHL